LPFSLTEIRTSHTGHPISETLILALTSVGRLWGKGFSHSIPLLVAIDSLVIDNENDLCG
jgi:hypothetical protein